MAFSVGGFNYPASWCALSSVEDLAEIGIISLTKVYPPLAPGYQYNGEWEDNLIDKTRTYLQSEIPPGLSGSASGNVAINVQAGWLVSIAVKSDDVPEKTVDIGTLEGGSDIVEGYLMSGDFTNLNIGRYFPDPFTIYVTCSGAYSYNILMQP